MTRVYPGESFIDGGGFGSGSCGEEIEMIVSPTASAEAASTSGSETAFLTSSTTPGPDSALAEAAATDELADTFGPLESSMSKRINAASGREKSFPKSIYGGSSPNSSPMRTLSPHLSKQTAVNHIYPQPPSTVISVHPVLVSSKIPVVADPKLNRTNRVFIEVRILFMKVGEIDTQKDRFTADVFIQCKWREPALDGKQNLTSGTEEINFDHYWNPKLMIQNGFGEIKETVYRSVFFDSKGEAIISEKRRVNGSFTEYMELNQFPFDTQDLTVTLTSDRSENEVQLVEDRRDRCGLNPESFVDAQEWYLHPYVRVWNSTREDDSKHELVHHSSISAACKASRKPQFFLWNIIVVMFMICGLSFTTFIVLNDLPHFRLTLTLILLLTTISFKFAVNQSLPMISYLTYLDKYILSLMLILSCICVWHAVLGKLVSLCSVNDSSLATSCRQSYSVYDTIALGVLGSMYVGFHALFVCLIGYIQYEKMKESDQFSGVVTVPINGSMSDMLESDDTEDTGFIPELRKRRPEYNPAAIDTSNQHAVIVA